MKKNKNKKPSPDAEDEKEQEEEEHSLVAEDEKVVSQVYVLNLGLWLAFLL